MELVTVVEQYQKLSSDSILNPAMSEISITLYFPLHEPIRCVHVSWFCLLSLQVKFMDIAISSGKREEKVLD